MIIGDDMPPGEHRVMVDRCPSCARVVSIHRRVQLPAVCLCGWLHTGFDSVFWCRGYERAPDDVLRNRILELETLLSTRGGEE